MTIFPSSISGNGNNVTNLLNLNADSTNCLGEGEMFYEYGEFVVKWLYIVSTECIR